MRLTDDPILKAVLSSPETIHSTPKMWHGGAAREKPMESEIKRLEDKISHVDEMGKARLEKVMAEIDGKFSLILERTDGIKADVSASRQAENQHFQWLAGLIVASALAIILAVGGFAYSAKSLWASGFSSGQTDRPAATQSSH